MLRVSAQTTETEIDIQGIAGNAAAAEQGIEYGALLVAYAEAIATRDNMAIGLTRQALENEAGRAVVVDAAGVAANFQRMVRIADSTGIPVDNLNTDLSRQTRQALSLDQFESARNSLDLT